jgi:trehalose utilization protein
MTQHPLRIMVWSEGLHDAARPELAAVYPKGIHQAIAEGLAALLPDDTVIRTATLAEREHGLTEAILEDTDVLLWWGHTAHEMVSEEIVDRVHRRVLEGMGLIVLHSAHFSKIFIRLMGTTCSLKWRNDGEREVVWTVSPTHPIAVGLDGPLIIEAQETYSEYFDVPTPHELIFISSFTGGEVFRSGMTFIRGNGKIFYFSPGDEAYPVYFDPQIRLILANAVRWARPTRPASLPTASKLERDGYVRGVQPDEAGGPS